MTPPKHPNCRTGMDKTIHYLFDPLCGWCYGATGTVTEVAGMAGVTLQLQPTGFFSGEGARQMGDEFAAYAWSSDQRIERLTGKRFTEQYRQQVLGDPEGVLDSGPATIALCAVWLTSPDKELEALEAIQHARYVGGRNITSLATLGAILESLDLKDAAARLLLPDADLMIAHRARVVRAQSLMQQVGARGVPTLILESAGRRRVMDHTAAYSDPCSLLTELEAV